MVVFPNKHFIIVDGIENLDTKSDKGVLLKFFHTKRVNMCVISTIPKQIEN